MNKQSSIDLIEEDILLQSDKEDKATGEGKVAQRKRSRSKKLSVQNIGEIAKGLENLIVTTGTTPTRETADKTSAVVCTPSTISGIEKFVFIDNSHLVTSDLPPSSLLKPTNESLSSTLVYSTQNCLVNDPINTPGRNKRQRDPSPDTTPVPKKSKKMMMMPPPVVERDANFVRQLVLLVPDNEEFALFEKGLVDKLHASVLKAIKEDTNPEVKFDFAGPDRGRIKFVCPNEIAKEWALKIVPKLTGLWNDAKIKSVGGDCPKMVKASITFNNKPPNTVDLLEGIDNKNPTLDTLHWREYKRQKVQGGKTVLFIGVDEGSIRSLKDLGFRPYFEAGRIRLNVPNNNNGA